MSKDVGANPLAPAWLQPPRDANALASHVWPQSMCRDGLGAAKIGSHSALNLARCFGTPLYVVDEADARARAADLRRAADEAAHKHAISIHVYYASKAFLCTSVVRWMAEAGLRIDVCSGGELAFVQAAGIDPATVGLHGNNKSRSEIGAAVQAGVGAIVIDCEREIDHVAFAASSKRRVQPVRLRINSAVRAATHAALATSHADQKFGVSPADAVRLVAKIRSLECLRFLGLHAHIGSQIFDITGFTASARQLVALHARLLQDGPVPEVNLGGGFGIAYVPTDAPAPASQILTTLVDEVAAMCHEHAIPLPDLAFEPGRCIIGPAGVTLYEVGAIKDVPVAHGSTTAIRKYVSVDGGMSDNSRPALYGAPFHARLANRSSKAAPVLARVVGKHCESGDVVVDADYLPADVAPGDCLAVAATGAYCHSLASNYNMLPRPPVVALCNGYYEVIIRGETIADLLARDPFAHVPTIVKEVIPSGDVIYT